MILPEDTTRENPLNSTSSIAHTYLHVSLWRRLLRLPNLLSLSRIPLAGIVAYLISKDELQLRFAALGVICLAGVTDFLDGFAARHSKQWLSEDRLGVILDPVADKIFAITVLIGLTLHGGFPSWLFALIEIGRAHV